MFRSVLTYNRWVLKPRVHFCYNINIMKKNLKFILGLTQKVGASQALLKNGTKNLFVIGAADGLGLITGQFAKPLKWPIRVDNACRRLLNPTSFIIEFLRSII